MKEILIVLHLIFVHGPDGQEIEVNMGEISTIRDPKADEAAHYAAGTECVIVMTNGKFISTKETCKQIIEAVGTTEGKESK